jgi:hypothetical protein
MDGYDSLQLARDICDIMGLKSVTNLTIDLNCWDAPRVKATMIIDGAQAGKIARVLKHYRLEKDEEKPDEVLEE